MADSTSNPQAGESKAALLAQYFLEARSPSTPTKSSPSLVSQMEHRIDLVSYWEIKPGSRVLELGCGQGDCTVVLADAVGLSGHIDAVDPGAADYGSPFTLSQAQSHISSSLLGPRISFHLAVDPITYLASYTGPKYDAIVLCHCIYYFSSPTILSSILTALKPHCTNSTSLCLAEWSLRSMKTNSQSHVLTALLLSMNESRRKIHGRGNIRTVLSPRQIRENVEGEGFGLLKEEVRESNAGLRDAYWEVSDLLRKMEKVLSDLEGDGVREGELMALRSMYDAVQLNVDGLEGGLKGVRCMDVWVGKFGVV